MPCCWRRSRRLANKHVLTGGANPGEFRLNCARCYWNRCCNIAIPPTTWNSSSQVGRPSLLSEGINRTV
jgi:hypothetical protein